jgi:hypothetical protein
MEQDNPGFIEYFLSPLHCCGAWSIGFFFIYIFVGASIFGFLLGTSIRFAMQVAGVPVSSALYKQFTAAVGELNRAAFSQNAATIVFAIVTLPVIYRRSIENANKIYLLILLSIVFFIYAWFAVKGRARQAYLSLTDKRSQVFIYIYYGFVLILMSSVLFSGPDGTVGMLRGRWYGALYIFFPVATAVVARIATYAIHGHESGPQVK